MAQSKPPPTGPQLREKVFKFPESTIDKIKAKVNQSDGVDPAKPFSTFQSLSAHIWRHVTMARELKPEEYTVYTVFADCRKRVDPEMPEQYFGNLIQAIFTVTAAGLLVGSPPAFGAATVQKAVEGHNAKAILARNEEWEAAPKIFQYKVCMMIIYIVVTILTVAYLRNILAIVVTIYNSHMSALMHYFMSN